MLVQIGGIEGPKISGLLPARVRYADELASL